MLVKVVFMVKRITSNIKKVLAAVLAIIMAFCFGVIALGCEEDESYEQYALRIAKEEFGCKKILWYGGGGAVISVNWRVCIRIIPVEFYL